MCLLGRRPEGGDEAGDQGGQEYLASQRLHDGDGPAAVAGGSEIPVAESGQGGEAEVLERLGVTRLTVGKEAPGTEVLHRRVEGGEHQADDDVGAQGTVNALHGHRGPGQDAAHDEDRGEE